MPIDSLDAVLYTCIFILPGFMIQEIAGSISPRKKQSDSKYFIYCLMYSMIHFAVWSWVYILLRRLYPAHLYWYWFLLVFVTVVCSTLLALIIGLIEYYGVIAKCLNAVKIKSSLPQPTAWDYFFSRQEPAWVIVTLVDGSTIWGKYADNSFSSSESEERDLYIEQTYRPDEKGNWIPDERSKGVLIVKDQIKMIEFIE